MLTHSQAGVPELNGYRKPSSIALQGVRVDSLGEAIFRTAQAAEGMCDGFWCVVNGSVRVSAGNVLPLEGIVKGYEVRWIPRGALDPLRTRREIVF